jgi:hypothetical protein
MERQNDSMRELLLKQLPQAETIAAYREEVRALLEKNEKALRGKKWTVLRMWIFIVVMSVPMLWMAGTHFGTPEGNWFLGCTVGWVILGAIEVTKYAFEQGKVELLKEVKQLQLQMLEIQSRFGSGAS